MVSLFSLSLEFLWWILTRGKSSSEEASQVAGGTSGKKRNPSGEEFHGFLSQCSTDEEIFIFYSPANWKENGLKNPLQLFFIKDFIFFFFFFFNLCHGCIFIGIQTWMVKESFSLSNIIQRSYSNGVTLIEFLNYRVVKCNWNGHTPT